MFEKVQHCCCKTVVVSHCKSASYVVLVPDGELQAEQQQALVVRQLGPDCEGPVVSEAEVDDGATEDRDAICCEQGQACHLNEERHDGEVSKHRDEPIREMKARQLRE